MRVLTIGHLYPPHSLGGYEVVWRSWVRHTRAAGHEVAVLASDFTVEGRSDDPSERVRRELRWYWRDHRFPRFAPWTRLAIERHNARVLDDAISELHPQIVVWWSMAGMSTALIERVRRAGIPAVAVLGDYWIEYAPQVDGWMRLFAGRPRLSRLAERITGEITTVDMGAAFTPVFASERLRRGAAEVVPAFAQAEVVHQGPERDLFRPVPAGPWRWRLLCLGRVMPEKGTDLAVAALAHLPDRSTLAVLGGGEVRSLEAIREQVDALGLGDRVTVGEVPHDQAPAAYASADAVLFPVRWPEPWGLVPLEAMAVGRPVIASGRGGSGEYLRDGENCLMVNPDEGPHAVAEAVRRLAADPDLRDRLIAGGTQTVDAMDEPGFNQRLLEIAVREAGGVR